ncbi:Uncharacterized protein SAPIO_CDS5506 [Scedosporium apiospermum]|uniref:Pal1 cell morphology protein n=1 Tax=Pseudallescheria apiosperma TaxID=563466 RepID=A0A084G4S7_PSEDA|nr:Uncharacterized protein SAPIO_CDS5506 [Scedosporium apiospermum]KEZ42339.1 Uncharacterized protein SAPIO_CDS5506 [Scedosporium apiospermum]
MAGKSPEKRPKGGTHRGHHRRESYARPDPIDVLDNTPFGGAYHHTGPYEATLAANNMNKKYSPVAAVHESNMAALRATPREYVQDSLTKHVPLQGTATIPPGEPDFNGDIMDYEDGADLMREPDAGGGPYRRWEGLSYRPEDLKGKGEPSYTYEESEKARNRLRKSSLGSSPAGSSYEMQPQRPARYSDSPSKRLSKTPSVQERKRSVSDVAKSSSAVQEGEVSSYAGLRRRWGSLRKKSGG